MSDDFSIKEVSNKSVDETWKPVWGQYSNIRNNYNEIAVELIQSGSNPREMIVRFRLFNDGLGFRYEFPEQKNLNYFTLLDEITEFRLSGDHIAFGIPGDYDTNEFSYTTAKFPK